MDEPDQIGPDHSPKRTLRERVRRFVRAFTTKYVHFSIKLNEPWLTWIGREGLIGDYNYAYLFTPRIPFTRKSPSSPPFFGLNDRVPVLLAFLLGLQHSLAMLAGGVYISHVYQACVNVHSDRATHPPRRGHWCQFRPRTL